MALSYTHSILMLILLLLFFFDLPNETMAQPPPDSGPLLCHDDERSILLDFMKESFNATSWILNEYLRLPYYTGEYDNVDCCSWEGAECDQVTGHVIGISVGLFQLDFIYGIPIDSSFPSNSSIFRLIHLKNLSLHINFKHLQIPHSITNLTSLELLNLPRCNISGVIPLFLNNFTQLSYLDLFGNDLSGVIPSFLGNFTQLSYLDLSRNKFTSQQFSSLYWISHLPKLKSLRLSYTNLRGEVPLFIRNMTQIEELYFSGSNLYLMNNINVFDNLNRLTGLDISNINLNGLFETNNSSFILPSSLKVLYLNYCNLNKFPSFLQKLRNLRELSLDSNNMYGKIPEWFMSSSAKYLEDLSLDNNSLIGFERKDDHLPLPWSNLAYLDLANNMFQGSLPIPLTYLQTYYVSNNNFSRQFSPLFCNLNSSNIYFDVSSNFLSGTIPQCFKNLANDIRVLNLKNNSFVGRVPEIWKRNCSYMEAIDLSFNQLHGTIPKSLANCKSLQFISLKSNSFKDHLPRWLGSLPNLTVIDLSQNRLQGEVPKSWAECKNLQLLNIRGNRIEDYFPSWLGNLSDLRVLSLSSNMFHGSIRITDLSGSQFGKLHFLDISSNYFVGHLPLKLFKYLNAMKQSSGTYIGRMIFSQLDISVKLSYKGDVIDYEWVPEALVILDFSNNNFSGNIPDMIGDLSGLFGLNLSSNILTGNIPSSLGKLSALEYMDLSQNKLSGNIPQELTHLDNLCWLDLSNNRLSGTIPKGEHFDTLINKSIEGNVGLCGENLLNKCFNETSQRLGQKSKSIVEIEWNIVRMGFGTGMIIGLSLGYLFTIWKHEWFAKIATGTLWPK